MTTSSTRTQAREMAHQALKKAILSGTSRPSQHLAEQTMADQLKVSKNELADKPEAANHLARLAFLAGKIHEVHQHFSDFDEIVFAQSDSRLLRQHDGTANAIRRGDARAVEEFTRLHVRSLMEDELERRRLGSRTSAGLLG